MSISVQIPAPLRGLTRGASVVHAEASDVHRLIDALEVEHPGLKGRLCGDDGTLRPFLRIFVNDEDVRFLEEGRTALKAGDVVAIVPAIAGGSGAPECPPEEKRSRALDSGGARL